MELTVNSSHEAWKKVFRKAEQIVSREIAGETILVPIRGELADMQRVFWLNSVAEYTWHQLDGERSLGEILDGILAKFDVEREQAQADLQEFIAELLEEGLIVGG